MTLLELLVQELPKRGGWPEAANKLKFSTTRRIVDDVDNEYFHFPYLDRLVLRERVKFVTREQYESAIAAKKPSWNGVGLPPVGCECEFRKMMRGKPDEFRSGVVSYFSEHTVVIIVNGESGEFVHHPDTCEFRPIRSEADKKRDAAIKAIDDWLPEFTDTPYLYHATAIYAAIEAGSIPGVKLED